MASALGKFVGAPAHRKEKRVITHFGLDRIIAAPRLKFSLSPPGIAQTPTEAACISGARAGGFEGLARARTRQRPAKCGTASLQVAAPHPGQEANYSDTEHTAARER